MALVKLLTFWFFVIISSHFFADSTTENKIDDKQLERELKILNKPPVKTIKSKEGDIIDCIDIYKQPTLDHPLLRNHTIKLRPNGFSKNDKSKISARRKALKIHGIVDCPPGTVPIRRTSKDDLIRAKSFFNKTTKNIHPLTGLTPGRHQAIVRAESFAYKGAGFHGIEAQFSIHNPAVRRGQASSSQMWIENNSPGYINSIQFGWTVNPELYGDNRTRTFGLWHTTLGEEGPPTGCFNNLCRGFVQTDPGFFMGQTLSYASYDSNEYYYMTYRIMKERNGTNWWLIDMDHNIYVGYWVSGLNDILPTLESGGTMVIWGGQTFADTSAVSPAMSCGHFPPNDNTFGHGCFIRNMKIIDARYGHLWDAPSSERFVDSNCYNLTHYGDNGYPHGISFLFGGPGGNNCGP